MSTRKSHKVRNGIGLAFIGLTALVISVNAANGGTTHLAAAPKPAVTAPAAPAPAAPAPSAPAAPAAPAPTAAQQQALSSAQGYLSDGQGFSEAGLLKQLTSSYGEKFATADAEWAIAQLHPDWNAQAVISAKGYMSDGQGFSRDGLIQQLTSSYGEGFTLAQATYAVNQVGL